MNQLSASEGHLFQLKPQWAAGTKKKYHKTAKLTGFIFWKELLSQFLLQVKGDCSSPLDSSPLCSSSGLFITSSLNNYSIMLSQWDVMVHVLQSASHDCDFLMNCNRKRQQRAGLRRPHIAITAETDKHTLTWRDSCVTGLSFCCLLSDSSSKVVIERLAGRCYHDTPLFCLSHTGQTAHQQQAWEETMWLFLEVTWNDLVQKCPL